MFDRKEITEKRGSSLDPTPNKKRGSTLFGGFGKKKENEPTELTAAQKKIKNNKDMVEYYCNDERDDSRFMTAWFFVNTNVTDATQNIELKKLIIDS